MLNKRIFLGLENCHILLRAIINAQVVVPVYIRHPISSHPVAHIVYPLAI